MGLHVKDLPTLNDIFEVLGFNMGGTTPTSRELILTNQPYIGGGGPTNIGDIQYRSYDEYPRVRELYEFLSNRGHFSWFQTDRQLRGYRDVNPLKTLYDNPDTRNNFVRFEDLTYTGMWDMYRVKELLTTETARVSNDTVTYPEMKHYIKREWLNNSVAPESRCVLALEKRDMVKIGDNYWFPLFSESINLAHSIDLDGIVYNGRSFDTNSKQSIMTSSDYRSIKAQYNSLDIATKRAGKILTGKDIRQGSTLPNSNACAWGLWFQLPTSFNTALDAADKKVLIAVRIRFYTSNTEPIYYMFQDNRCLYEVDDNFMDVYGEANDTNPKWNNYIFTHPRQMFENCVNLVRVGALFGPYTKKALIYTYGIFKGCTNLRYVNPTIYQDCPWLMECHNSFQDCGTDSSITIRECYIPFNQMFRGTPNVYNVEKLFLNARGWRFELTEDFFYPLDVIVYKFSKINEIFVNSGWVLRDGVTEIPPVFRYCRTLSNASSTLFWYWEGYLGLVQDFIVTYDFVQTISDDLFEHVTNLQIANSIFSCYLRTRLGNDYMRGQIDGQEKYFYEPENIIKSAAPNLHTINLKRMFRNQPNLIDLGNICKGLVGLRNIGGTENLFPIHTNLRYIHRMFQHCHNLSLTETIGDLFPVSTRITDAYYTFAFTRCNVDVKALLGNKSNITSSEGMFYVNYGIKELHQDAIHNCSANNINVRLMFAYCLNLCKLIPVEGVGGFFSKLNKANASVTAEKCFYNTAMPIDPTLVAILSPNTESYRWSSDHTMFKIPYEFFYGASDCRVTNLSECFALSGWCNVESYADSMGNFDNYPYLTTMFGLFENSLLSEISLPFITNCPLLTNCNQMFCKTETSQNGWGYLNSLSIYDATGSSYTFFNNCPNVSTIQSMFYRQNWLRLISNSMFNHCLNITDASYAFEGCERINELVITSDFLPSPKLRTLRNIFLNVGTKSPSSEYAFSVYDYCFENRPELTTVYYAFYGANIGTLGKGIFRNCSKLTNAECCFCANPWEGNALPTGSINSIRTSDNEYAGEDNIFYGCTELDNIKWLFGGQKYITQAFPKDMFKTNLKIKNARYAFSSCHNAILKIGPDFLPSPEILNLQSAFQYVGYTNPNGGIWFEPFAFENRTKLSSITDLAVGSNIQQFNMDYGLFRNCTALQTASGCFNNTDNNQQNGIKFPLDRAIFTDKYNYDSEFSERLEYGDRNIFYGCTNLTNLVNCFYKQKNILTIPSDVIKYCPKLQNISRIFFNCNTATLRLDKGDIPTTVTNLWQSFSHIGTTNTDRGLTFADSGLYLGPEVFANCTELTGASSTFSYSKFFKLHSNLFKNCTNLVDVQYIFIGIRLQTGITYVKNSSNQIESFFVGCNKLANISNAFREIKSDVPIEIDKDFFKGNTAITYALETFRSSNSILPVYDVSFLEPIVMNPNCNYQWILLGTGGNFTPQTVGDVQIYDYRTNQNTTVRAKYPNKKFRPLQEIKDRFPTAPNAATKLTANTIYNNSSNIDATVV